jgi:hypothetical protein
VHAPPTRSCPVQITTREPPTQTRLYGPDANMELVLNALLGTTHLELASEQQLTPEVCKGLGDPTFRETVVAMLSRDPAARPRMPDLVQC